MSYSTDTGTELPLLPVTTVVFALGVLDVIAEVPTGFVVLQVALTVQLLAPAAMMHAVGESVSVPAGTVADDSRIVRDTPSDDCPVPFCTNTLNEPAAFSLAWPATRDAVLVVSALFAT